MQPRTTALFFLMIAALAVALSGCGGGVGGGLELQGTCYLYAASYGANELRPFSVAADGTMTALAAQSLYGVNHVVATAGGHVYASYYDRDTTEYRIAAYAVNPSDGSLSPLGTAVELAGQPMALALDPQERFLYAATFSANSICKYTIQPDGSLGAGIALTITYDLRGLAVSRDGYNLYGPSLTGPPPYKVMAYRINQTTGELTVNGDATVTGQPWYDMASPVADRIYVGTGSTGRVAAFEIVDSTTAGTLSALAGSPFPGANLTPNLLAIHPDGTYMLAEAADPDLNYVLEEFAIAADGSVLSKRTISVDGKLVSGAVFHPGGQAVFVACNYAGTGDNLYSYRFNADGTMSLIDGCNAGNTLMGVAAVVFNP